jgi:hypothetical protein
MKACSQVAVKVMFMPIASTCVPELLPWIDGWSRNSELCRFSDFPLFHFCVSLRTTVGSNAFEILLGTHDLSMKPGYWRSFREALGG